MADEPTGSLDNFNSKIVMDNIVKLSKKLKTLTIIATHNLQFLPQFDFTYEIANGKLRKFKWINLFTSETILSIPCQ